MPFKSLSVDLYLLRVGFRTDFEPILLCELSGLEVSIDKFMICVAVDVVWIRVRGLEGRSYPCEATLVRPLRLGGATKAGDFDVNLFF
jgi:hypothetical protein